jgi:hypothetical protein
MNGSVVGVTRWIARTWGTAAALFWGAFLLEHFAWFTSPTALPPLRVWLLQGLHLAMVASLLAAWRYERVGGIIAVVASVLFFGEIGGPRMWPFLMTTLPPAIGFLYCGFAGIRPRLIN